MTNSEPARLLGHQTPRLQHLPPSVGTLGREAVELAALAGLHLDPWEAWVIEQSCAVKEETFYNQFTDEWQRMWAAFEVGLIVSRQNGKGSILEARELAGLFLFGERLIVHSAHQFDTSMEHMRRILELIEGTPDFDSEVKSVTRGNGKEGIELKSGQRLRFRTRTKGGGRGFTGDLLVLDEAMYLDSMQIGALLPTLSARPNPQVWYTGSAGDKESTALGRVRSRGIKHTDHRLFFAEWSIDACTPFCLARCDEHDPVDTVESYAKANPGLGIRITVEHVQSEQRSMDEATFGQERLGIGDWPSDGDQWAVIDEESWKARTDETSAQVDDKDSILVLAVDTSPQREFSAIGSCALNEAGLLHVEVTGYEQYDHRPGTQWVVPRVLELWNSLKPDAVAIDKVAQAGAFIPALEEAGVKVISPSTAEYAQACGEFHTDVVPRKGESPKVVHLGQEPLTLAVAGADKRDLAEKWAWSKKNSSNDISPLVSVTLAAWGYRKVLHERPAAATPWVFRR